MVTEHRQRHQPPPATHEEFRTLVEAGALITTGGKLLARVPCRQCGGLLLGSTDGAETCWCVFGNRPHDSRVALALADTHRRAEAGDPDVPAKWPAPDPEQPALW